MPKVDFKKELKQYYSASKITPAIIDVPKMNFIQIDGTGDPNTSQSFQKAVEALYGIAYTLKFSFKDAPPKGYFEFVVPPLEGLWWMDGPFDPDAKDKWKWTLMIMQPDFVTAKLVEKAIEILKQKKPSPALADIRYESYKEGLAAQIMHIGPYAEEGPTIEKLHEFVRSQGYTLHSKHHEIYLSDPRRTAPEKLKTILRHPIEKL